MYRKWIETYECKHFNDEFKICSVSSNGVNAKFKVYNKDKVISDAFRTSDWWESWMHNYIDKYMKGNLFIDIGGNIGSHSIYAALKGNKVWSFEPQKFVYNILQSNKEINNIQNNLELFNIGLSEHNTTTNMNVIDYNNETNIGGLGIGSGGEEIVTELLDDIWFNYGKPKVDLIKIDVEGHEPSVIRGAKKLLIKEKPVILFEDHVQGDSDTKSELIKLDYKIEQIKRTDWIAISKK